MPAFLKPAQILLESIAFSHASFNSLGKLYFVICTPGFLDWNVCVALFHSVFNGLNTHVSRGWDMCVEWGGRQKIITLRFLASWQTLG